MAASRQQLNKPRRGLRTLLTFAGVALGCALSLGLWATWHKQTASVHSTAARVDAAALAAPARYAGSSTCQQCHEEEFKLWETSHHGLAQRSPVDSLDKTAFERSQTVLSSTHRVTVGKAGTNYEVATYLGNTQQLFSIRSVLGESPLRQFLISFPQGRLQALEAAYDPRSNEWFNVFGDEDRRSGEWGHWTGRGMNWNSMCADCHNTRLRKAYDQARDAYHTTLAEESVGCEACHGPLGEHNDWQARFGKSGRKDPTIRKLSREQVLDNCGFCHARRGELTGDFKPGDNFFDDMRLEIVNDSRTFYPDGQVHEEDYEYAAFLGSRMQFRGVHCMDCHNPHSAKTILPGNWLCMRCHNGSYTNAPLINPVGHSHHKVYGYDAQGIQTNLDLTSYQTDKIRESGGECVNCHMPQTVYMQRHVRHDHGFTIPDPFLTSQAGVPNACNRCHREKNAEWALNWCKEWYGQKMERPSRFRALLIAAARKLDPTVRPGLLAMLATNENAYWRAVAAGLAEPWANERQVQEQLCSGLKDTNALVRSQCIRSLEPVAQEPAVAEALNQSLADPVRGVRVAAAWALRHKLDLSSRAAADLDQCLAINADQPAGQMQLGAFALARGDTAMALTHYQKAVDWDPGSGGLRHDYAVLLAELHRAQEAVEQLQAACRLEPTNAEFQYSLALGWNDLGRTTNAVECLQEAVRLEPSFARAWYNLGLALDAIGREEDSIDALLRAESADLADARAPYARATILSRAGRWTEAQKAAQRALEIEPGFGAARELLRSIEADRSSAR